MSCWIGRFTIAIQHDYLRVRLADMTAWHGESVARFDVQSHLVTSYRPFSVTKMCSRPTILTVKLSETPVNSSS
jgi:hypothetical protein